MQKIKSHFSKIKEYYQEHPKRFWVLGGIVLVVLLYSIFHTTPSKITVAPVVRGTLKQTVLATGQVTAQTDLNLSFSASGLVSSLPVSVGDKVYQGQVLAMLNNSSEYASLKLAKANYDKIVAGNSSEQIEVAKVALDNARKVQDTLVESAYRSLLNVDLTPILVSGSLGTAPTITGTYSGDDEGSYTISPNVTGSGSYFTYSGVETGTGEISTTSPKPLGTKGLYIQFNPDYVTYQNDIWSVLFPNKKSTSYLAAYNTYQNAVKTHDSTIAAAEADLNLKKAAARPADLAAAQASVDQAQALYENTVLRAPSSGTVVHVDTKLGERADAQKEVIVIQDVDNLHVEANINETNIAKVKLGLPVVMTLDAFGPEVLFTGKVIEIDPSATTTDGVVNYKIKTSINPPCEKGATCAITNDMVRPGMNANMNINAWEHQNILSIPKAAIDQRADGAYVRIVTDDKNDAFEWRKIEVGALGDGNMIEVASGLNDGEKVAVGEK